MIFFICNFKIYYYIGGETHQIEFIDNIYKYKKVNKNLFAYQPVDDNKKRTNEINYISIEFSDFSKGKILEESEGKLEEFLI
jgi:hypothetical protein